MYEVYLSGTNEKIIHMKKLCFPYYRLINQILLENQEPKIFHVHEKHISTTN